MTNQKEIRKLDLKASSNTSRVITTIEVYDPGRFTYVPWIETGGIHIRRFDHSDRKYAMIQADVDGAYDEEHSTAYLLSFDIVGMALCDVWAGRTTIVGHLIGDEDDFRVPNGDYDPLHSGIALTCEEEACNSHPIVPYMPPANPLLYQQLKGLLVKITIWPQGPKLEEASDGK